MWKRILLHLLFWTLFILLYAGMKVFFAGPSDLVYSPWQRLGRFLLNELFFLPWKMIPFYALFYYLIPQYFQKGRYLQTALFFLAVLIPCLYGYRAMIAPVSQLLYNEAPDFPVYSLERMVYTLTDVIPAIGLASTLKLLKSRIQSQQREQELQREKLQSELKFLKAQIHPHFLFNTLNNLYGLARRNDQHTAPSILKLASLMRYILYECAAPTVPIATELHIIQDYIALEQLRYNDQLRVSLQVDLTHEQIPIAPLLLLPFVENAFKHGAGESRFDRFIDITIHQQGPQLYFCVHNSRDPEQVALIEGIGLSNVRRQLELSYGQNYALEINPDKNTFTVKLTIRLEAHE